MHRITTWLGALALLALYSSALAEPVSTTRDGVVLNADLTLAPGRTLADGVVLMLHGTLAHHGMELIATLQHLLAERGRSTLAVSLSLGISNRTGMFDCNQPHTHRHEDPTDELAWWAQWLDSRGAGAIALLGHSRGGNQVARFALANPSSSKAVILVAPATYDRARMRYEYERRSGESLDDRLDASAKHPPEAMMENVPFLHCGPTKVRASTFLSYYGDDPTLDTPSLLASIASPTLVIAGTADTIVPDVAIRTREVGASGTTLVEIAGADHFFRDLYAEDVADAIEDFLSQPRMN